MKRIKFKLNGKSLEMTVSKDMFFAMKNAARIKNISFKDEVKNCYKDLFPHLQQ